MTDHAYVAYLDILGYKELLDADLKAGTHTFKDRMTRAFRTFEEINTSRHHYKAISDSIFISCTDRSAANEFLCVVRDVYIAFLSEGLMIRGGVSYGQHFENPSITYSPVLTKAYLLESEVAEFPRVMVDSNIYDMFPELKNEGLLLRTGSHWFLNVVTKDTFEDVWNAAMSAFTSSKPIINKSERVRIKHRWLQDFLIEVSLKFGITQPQPYLPIFDEEQLVPEIVSSMQAEDIAAVTDTQPPRISGKGGARQAILEALENGPADINFIAKMLNLNPLTVRFVLREFSAAGRVMKNSDEKRTMWTLVPQKK